LLLILNKLEVSLHINTFTEVLVVFTKYQIVHYRGFSHDDQQLTQHVGLTLTYLACIQKVPDWNLRRIMGYLASILVVVLCLSRQLEPW